MNDKQILPSVSIEAVLERREAMLEKIGQAFRLLREAEQIAKSDELLTMPRMDIENGVVRGDRISFAGTSFNMNDEAFVTNVKAVIDRDLWHRLLKASGVTTLMDIDTRVKLREQIEGGVFPEVSYENIRDTFQNLYEQREAMFENGILGVFRHLSWDYKTNLPVRFGRKIIVERLCDRDGMPNYRVCGLIDDLNRAFHLLDGKPEPDNRATGTSRRILAATGRKFDETYYEIKWYKNGNGHLTFKRQDLVDRLNEILAKHHPDALPCAA